MNSGDGSAKPAAAVDRWLHCNACYTVPDAGGGNHYYFVSCGHIFCRNCCAKGAELAKAATCLLCKKTQVQYMDINRNIQTKFRNLFRPLKDVAQECMTEMQRVIEFQQRHKNGLVRHFSDKNQKAVTFAKSVRCELEKQKGREQQFVKERTELLKHVERLRKENEQLKSQMERLRHQPLPQPDYMSAAPGKTPDSGLGTNDSLSLSFIETVTSTPIIEQGPNTRRHLAAAFQTSSGSVPSPICSANRLLTTPAMLGLSKTPHAFHTRELVTPRSAVPYEKVGLSGGMRIVEERRVLTDRRPKSKKQNGSRGQNSDDYMDGIS